MPKSTAFRRRTTSWGKEFEGLRGLPVDSIMEHGNLSLDLERINPSAAMYALLRYNGREE